MDDRWVGGRWDLSMFKDSKGETDWDAVSCPFWEGGSRGGAGARGGGVALVPAGHEELRSIVGEVATGWVLAGVVFSLLGAARDRCAPRE